MYELIHVPSGRVLGRFMTVKAAQDFMLLDVDFVLTMNKSDCILESYHHVETLRFS